MSRKTQKNMGFTLRVLQNNVHLIKERYNAFFRQENLF